MTDNHIPAEWRYSINYGPEGEANYAFVYDEGGHLVSNLKIHHAIAVVEQMNDRAAQAERMARLEEALRPFADEFRRLEKNYVGFEIMFTDDVVYVGGKLTIGHLRRAALGNGGGDA